MYDVIKLLILSLSLIRVLHLSFELYQYLGGIEVISTDEGR